jgi:hypothetical protein
MIIPSYVLHRLLEVSLVEYPTSLRQKMGPYGNILVLGYTVLCTIKDSFIPRFGDH